MTEPGAHSSRFPAPGLAKARRRPMSRRAMIAGAVPVAAATVSAVGSLALQISRTAEAPDVPASPKRAVSPDPTANASAPSTPIAVDASAVPAGSPSAGSAAQVTRSLPNLGVPQGMVLVGSRRLPIAGVGPEDPWRLLTRQVTNWAVADSPVPLMVRPVALANTLVRGMRPDQVFESYDALTAAMDADPGAVALIPAESVDFRVQALSVGETDPLGEPLGGLNPVRIGVIGDVVPGRNVHLHMVKYGDFTRPFHRVAPLLRSFDLTVANLEGNLSDTLPQPADPHSVTFVSSPAMLEGFAMAGIDAVTLANNHTVWNSEGWGVQGLLDTIAALDTYGVPFFGAGTNLAAARAPWIVEVRGTRIAFLGIDAVTANYEVEPGMENGVLDVDSGAGEDRAGTNPYLAAQVVEDVVAATTVADVVIPYFHLGAEYIAVPPAWAVEATHMAIDAGAAMVVTNHPHLIQGMEIYAGKPIVYSPGNFILDQMWAAEVRSGYALEIVLRGSTIVGLRFHGVEIEEFHQPRPMTSGEQAALMDRFWGASDRRAARDGAEGQS